MEETKDITASHNERVTRLLELYPDRHRISGYHTAIRGNYMLLLRRTHNNIEIELYNVNSDPLADEPLLNTIPGGNLIDRVARFKRNWDEHHHRLKHEHLLLTMELTRIFSILIPEHMPS